MSNNRTPRRGVLLIVASPSGAGKTSLCRRLMADHKGLELSVSMTTRDIRPGEVDGRDYNFVSTEEFQRLIDADAFLEWADVHGNRYGSPAAPVERALAEAATSCSTSTGRAPATWPPNAPATPCGSSSCRPALRNCAAVW